MKQFLLNPDGSIPPGVDVAVLEAEGITMVLPTPRPEPTPGYDLAESEPVFEDGMWRQVWIEVERAPYVEPVPTVVSMRQARLALLGAGLLDQVESALMGIEDEMQRRAALITWEYATEVRRDDPLVTRLSTVFGLTEEQVDDMFREAGRL